jgi:hypothetical protein
MDQRVGHPCTGRSFADEQVSQDGEATPNEYLPALQKTVESPITSCVGN